MMRACRNIFVRLVLATLLCLVGESRCAVAELPEAGRALASRIVVALRSRVQVAGRVIRIDDIAQVSGGDADLRDRVKKLDLEDAVQSGESLTITPTQIEFRLQLAGINVDGVSIRGTSVRVTALEMNSPRGSATQASAVRATSNSTQAIIRKADSLEDAVVKVASDLIVSKLPWKADRIEIRLALPLPREVSQIDNAVGYDCRAELRAAGPALGRVQVHVVAEAPNRPAFDLQVLLDVRHFDDVVLTTKTLERGQTISAADVYLDRQDVTDLTDYCSNVDHLIGATVKRSVRSLMPLRKGDLEPAERSENAILIKRRDRVKMIAKAGAVSVTVMGEALQEGRVGETIRLLNIDSKATVQGRVTGANEVEISF